MEAPSVLNLVVSIAILLAWTSYRWFGKLSTNTKGDHFATTDTKPGGLRDVVATLDGSGKDCIVFYGSQTGTAEQFASKLAHKGKTRFGLQTMVADLEEYDFSNLDSISNKFVVFILATYGEGEPTDNAVQFYEFITRDDHTFSKPDPPLQNLKYAAFGLGNNTYEHYNAIVRNTDIALGRLGASRIGDVGEGDDGSGTTEEDFLAWKESFWAALSKRLGLTDRDNVYEPSLSITERAEMSVQAPEPKTVSITTVVEKKAIPSQGHEFFGVTTNYLLALHRSKAGDVSPGDICRTYDIGGPRNRYSGIRVPIHIRQSNFKLPPDSSRPIIMIGPGTGVAPFRGFLQEKDKQARDGVPVGKMLLFFGCRNAQEDFLYKAEFEAYSEALGAGFEFITPFSRQGPKQVYAQHRLRERAAEVNSLLEESGYLYVCGDAANMAREVHSTVEEIIEEQRRVPKSTAQEIVTSLRAAGRYQEDVW
ncbi:NADPH cytochrome P450 oxidoreductase family protein [Aspergillus thermomutatus]|uniref:NADPH--hemoprotein reductase n=1 Tax=Aspergillus thermomutatus TaxID=41047 RepID=A0A397G2Y5_ASPTH|nr:uncharacterized protein CDV56_101463 [Aspergillus thermomutatus]RHZ43696.1 hypothetical protein CDV56_101463 [Aspergillus thermomutatus]